MRAILSLPLFLYLMIVANVLMLGRAPGDPSMINAILFELPLPSGREVPITVSDALILTAIVFLYFETFKATRTSVISIIDHSVSLFVFIVFLVEFMVVPQVGNTTFLILTVASLLDVVMGFTVTISTARRDLAVGG